MSSTANKKDLFERKAEESKKVKTNTKRPIERNWTPTHDANGVGAHSKEGYKNQSVAQETNGPPPKRSLKDLP